MYNASNLVGISKYFWWASQSISGIIYIRYPQSKKIQKPNNLEVNGSKKTEGSNNRKLKTAKVTLFLKEVHFYFRINY
jgi:hypothetical protein